MANGVTSGANGATSAGAPVRLLQPDVLSRLGNLELLARTVVDGVLTGLHRSPNFGFSQEFAEYRAYNEGDDLRFVDWNVYARTDRMYIKRFRGDTNTSLTVVLDASGSMAFGTGRPASQAQVSSAKGVTKFDYARYLSAALIYLANKQHDAVGTIIFDEKVRELVPPSSRPDAMSRLFATLEKQIAESTTDVENALDSLHVLSRRRGLLAVVSDFYTDPEKFLKTLQPLAQSQQDIVLFHLVDPMEMEPEFDSVMSLRDMEKDERMDVDPEWLKTEYRSRFSEHCDALQSAAAGVGADYVRCLTSEPLDDALQHYLLFRQRKL